jgi:hypothetical protein
VDCRFSEKVMLKNLSAGLLSDDAGRLDQGHPLVDFGIDQLAERLGRTLLGRWDVGADFGQPLGDNWILHRFLHGAVNLRIVRTETNNAVQATVCSFGSPASFADGTSGIDGARCGMVTTIGFSLLLRICGVAVTT